MEDAPDRTYQKRENLWDEQMPVDDSATEHPFNEPDLDSEESPYPETVGTSDPLVAVRDQEPYMPPIEPPVVPGGTEGIRVATGFGESPEEEAVRDGAPRGDEDIQDMALRVLQEDSMTSTLDLDVRVRDAVIYLRGRVASVDDAEYAQSVLGELPGVVDVVDDTEFDPNAYE